MEVVYVPRASGEPERTESLALAGRWLLLHPERLVVIPRKHLRFGKPALDAFCELFPTVLEDDVSEPMCDGKRMVLVWPSKSSLAKIDRFTPEAVCVLRWADETSDDWLAAHDAQPLLPS